ncbi:uncharacterized protein H6S33_004634 [Morchella sextelata]|uniref:uncharacterized protein n=1 Tax=Morchella sextelata TaxID=1174677 RepID=UPI001D0445B8|nr:uncharacterized protein H6S33_004634 [Morchella sextelata]KAH0605412.1 hypothetical protein H6S33_004634 [Morchella sextelata]
MLVGLGSSSWALGIAVAVFTFFSGVTSIFLLVINIRNGQHYNYVSILAIVVALGNFNSFVQQIYTLLHFSDLMLEAFRLATRMFQCNGNEPFPLFHTNDKYVSAFLSLQMYFVNSQGLLFFYWSLILFSSSWSLSPVWWKNKKIIISTKISCFALPAIQLGLLRLESLRDKDLAQLILMNCIILVNIGMGSVFLVLTLIHVITIHRQAKGATEVRLSRTYDGVVEFRPRLDQTLEKGRKRTGLGRLYIGSDGWLIARIALAFVMVEGLQIYTIVMQIFFLQRWAHFRIEWSRGLLEPLIDQSEEFANICSPIPGSFTGYLFFLVFGTTMESRAEIRRMRVAVGRWFCRSKASSRDDEEGRPKAQKVGSSFEPDAEFLAMPSPAGTVSSTLASDGTSPGLSAPLASKSQGLGFGFQFGLEANNGLRIYTPPQILTMPVTPTPPPQISFGEGQHQTYH